MFNKSRLDKINLSNLLHISNVLKKYEYSVYKGTLLGLVRDGGIIKGDDDVDILMNIKNRKNVKKEILKLKKFKINTKVSSDYFIQFVNEKHIKSFVDIYFFVDIKKNNYVIEKHNFLSFINNKKYEIHIPKKLIFPFKKSKYFKNVKLPNNPKGMCKYLYGKSWVKPIKKNSGYRVEIIGNKPLIIQRSRLGYFTRYIKQIIFNNFRKG
jgi:phosphorylcholine metabolism protein LicD|tara:strand:- start:213 stop:842 length:630 start_codon:yes stop_codon:yes gene_type:complete